MNKLKTLDELGCYMFNEWNKSLNAWNCYLIKKGFVSGYIKCFISNTKEDGENSAVVWANHNKVLKNGGMYEKFYNKMVKKKDK